MPTAAVNGVRLFYALTGEAGPPLVLVHGSWGDHHGWDRVVPALAEGCRVLVYDRRGHSQSERLLGQGSADQHGADVAALVEHLDLVPAHFVGNSFGGYVLLRLATRRPDLFRSLTVHEPPLFSLIGDEPDLAPMVREAHALEDAVIARVDAGDLEGGTRQFIETVLGPGAWEQLPPQARQTFVGNASTFVDDMRDPDDHTVNLDELASFSGPILLTRGDASPPVFQPILAKLAAALPRADTWVYVGAGHVPHLSHPAEYVAALAAFVKATDDANVAIDAEKMGGTPDGRPSAAV